MHDSYGFSEVEKSTDTNLSFCNNKTKKIMREEGSL